MIKYIQHYWKNISGMSATETALLFPILISLMMAIYDLGQGVIVNQKTVSASQVMADLIGRYEIVDVDLLDDITSAGRLAIDPYPLTDFGFDIISVEFDEDLNPIILWRVTDNMDGDDGALDQLDGIAVNGEGIVIVSIANIYNPFFSNFIVPSINMRERAFIRGRRTSVITCTDCP